jgi:hypothetical protein
MPDTLDKTIRVQFRNGDELIAAEIRVVADVSPVADHLIESIATAVLHAAACAEVELAHRRVDDTPTQVDLSTVPEADLIGELVNRFPTLAMGYLTHEGKTRHVHTGNAASCVGLLSLLRRQVLRDVDANLKERS